MRVHPSPRIVMDSDIRSGKPIIKGTRVPAEILVGKMASGMSADAVAEEYGVERADVLAALSYASRLISRKRTRVRRHDSQQAGRGRTTQRAAARLQCS